MRTDLILWAFGGRREERIRGGVKGEGIAIFSFV
jgi:hypothetical protein